MAYRARIDPSSTFQCSSSSAYSGITGSGALRLAFFSVGLEGIKCLPLVFFLDLSGELSGTSGSVRLGDESLSERSELEL